jgi:hypothetical protein
MELKDLVDVAHSLINLVNERDAAVAHAETAERQLAEARGLLERCVYMLAKAARQANWEDGNDVEAAARAFLGAKV